MGGVTASAVLAALEEVDDPEIPVSVVDLGLIYDVGVEDGRVTIEMTLTSLGCPAEDMLRDDIERRVSRLDGVDDVETRVVWDPPWTADRMSEEARETLKSFGISA